MNVQILRGVTQLPEPVIAATQTWRVLVRPKDRPRTFEAINKNGSLMATRQDEFAFVGSFGPGQVCGFVRLVGSHGCDFLIEESPGPPKSDGIGS
jgi:hypothetical protein